MLIWILFAIGVIAIFSGIFSIPFIQRRWRYKYPKVKSKAYKLLEEAFEIVVIDDYHSHTEWFKFGTVADFIAYAEKNKAISGVFETNHGDSAFIFYIYENRMYCVELEKWVKKK
jgi:hypothetical protein